MLRSPPGGPAGNVFAGPYVDRRADQRQAADWLAAARADPGTLYLLNDHDKHTVRPRTDITCVCVFNPPVTGREVHDENGVYPLVTEPASA